MNYEYGIRYIQDRHIQRRGLTEDKAEEWMSAPDWGVMNPRKVFEIVRRPIGDWEPFDSSVVD